MTGRVFEESANSGESIIALIDGLIRLSPEKWSIEQAVRAGLLLRIQRLFKAILFLGRCECSGEAMFAVSRLLTESAMNLKYLLLKGRP